MIKTSGASLFLMLKMLDDIQKEVLEINQASGHKYKISYQEVFYARTLGMDKEEMIELNTDICLLGTLLMTFSKMLERKISE